MNEMIALNRLKGKEKINNLFRKGTIHRTKLLLLKVLVTIDEENRLYAGVSVPKKIFARAVDRNRIKRQLRITLKNLEKKIPFSGSCMLIYNGRKMPKTHELFLELKIILERYG